MLQQIVCIVCINTFLPSYYGMANNIVIIQDLYLFTTTLHQKCAILYSILCKYILYIAL